MIVDEADAWDPVATADALYGYQYELVRCDPAFSDYPLWDCSIDYLCLILRKVTNEGPRCIWGTHDERIDLLAHGAY